MRTMMFVAVAAVTLAGCTRPADPPGASFAKETAGRVAGAPRSCISTFPNQNLRVLDPMTLAYGYGRTTYINRLGGPCPALSPYNTIIINADSGQYCRGDRVRGLEPGARIAGPSCNLGDWVPYSMP
jgi:hypothetical protein